MEVAWDSEKIYVGLPVASFTLGSLKSYLSSKTGVPPSQIKLYFNGGLMRDDNAPLSSFQSDSNNNNEGDSELSGSQRQSSSSGPSGLFSRNGFWGGILSGYRKNQRQDEIMKIRMVGSRETRAVVSDRPDLKNLSRKDGPSPNQSSSSSSPSSKPTTTTKNSKLSESDHVLDESVMISSIGELTRKAINESLPRVERLELQNSKDDNSNQQPPSEAEEPLESNNSSKETNDTAKKVSSKDEFAFLSEILLQSLLKLDGFQVESDWTKARSARKEGVRAVQGLLDRLDRIKSKELPNQASLPG